MNKDRKNSPGNLVTKPPLVSMASISLMGSWSIESWIATPFLLRTALESPTFATNSWLPLIRIAPISEHSSNMDVSVRLYAFTIAMAGFSQNPGCKNIFFLASLTFLHLSDNPTRSLVLTISYINS